MPAAVALMLEGMPSPRDLHLHRAAGRVVVLVGSRLVAEYGETDLAMRNMVIVTLRRLGFPGWRVAEVLGCGGVCDTAEDGGVTAGCCGAGRAGRPGRAAGAGRGSAGPGAAVA